MTSQAIVSYFNFLKLFQLSRNVKIYIWEVQFQSPEWFRGLSVLYRDHRKVSGGPLGGATCPGGPSGLNKGGNQLPSGLVRPPRAQGA